MKFLDLFAGIGGFRLGMESAGHKCIGFCEIDKFARASYKAIHDTKGEIELHDITAVSDEFIRGIGRVDIICGGFPCQAFSIAGNRRGFEDTRGTLFFEIARFASILRPKYLFLENVKGILNHENGITFETIISTLDELGYNMEWQLLNSKDFGVPQNRERVFIIGHLRGERTRRIFPLSSTGRQVDKHQEQSTNTLTTRYPNSQGVGSYIIESESQKVKSIGNIHPSGKGMNGEVYQADGLAPTLTSNSYHENNHLSFGYRIRKLTPRECWRLQGFPDWVFDKAQEVNSNSQLYKQAGNSVTVSVIAAIAKKL